MVFGETSPRDPRDPRQVGREGEGTFGETSPRDPHVCEVLYPSRIDHRIDSSVVRIFFS